MAVTHIAAAMGALAWMAGEWLVRRRPSLLGLCSGLAAITPAAGFVAPRSAAVIGAVAGLAIRLRQCGRRGRLTRRPQ